MEEREDSPYLSDEDRKTLEGHTHVFDYPLSEEQLKQLDELGYVVLKGFFSKEICEKMLSEIWEKAERWGVHKDDATTWEQLGFAGLFDIWHTPTYYDVRWNERLYSVFAQLLKDYDLTVSIDRVCLKPPGYHEIEKDGIKQRVEHPVPDFRIHNDMNLWDLSETKYQGGLALSDAPKGSGGLQLLPGFHKLEKIKAYRAAYERGDFHEGLPATPPGQDQVFVFFSDKKMIKEEVVEVPMEQGDFVIWNSRLPHSSAANTSPNWRYQCYVRYVPSKAHEIYRGVVARSFRTGVKPYLFSTGNETGDSNEMREVPYHRPNPPTWLGKRLLGLVEFDEDDEEEED